MKNRKITETLENLGLSENEAKVYLAALSLGPSIVSKISLAAQTKRTTVYSMVDSLKQKGLMFVEMRGFKKLYVAENPEKLESVINLRKEKLHNILPELSALYNLKGEESLIKYHEGLESVKSTYDTLLDSARNHEDYLVVSDIDQWYNLDKDYFESFVKRRSKRNIAIRVLLQNSETAQIFKQKEKNYNEEVKILPKDTQLTTNLVIIPKMVVIHQLTPPIMAIVIENKNIVQMHKEMFEIMWKSIPK